MRNVDAKPRTKFKTVTNQKVSVQRNSSGQALLRCQDRYLVERNQDGGWDLMSPEDRFVASDELQGQIGLWKDSPRVIKESRRFLPGSRVTERFAPNGRIENDEVIPMEKLMKKPHQMDLGIKHWNHLFATVDHASPQEVELTLKPEGGSFETSWSVAKYENHLPANVEPKTNDYLWA